MRGSRTWFALAMNWLAIVGLSIIGNVHTPIAICGIVVILASFFIVSGEMKWWKNDHGALQVHREHLKLALNQIKEYRQLLKNVPVVK